MRKIDRVKAPDIVIHTHGRPEGPIHCAIIAALLNRVDYIEQEYCREVVGKKFPQVISEMVGF